MSNFSKGTAVLEARQPVFCPLTLDWTLALYFILLPVLQLSFGPGVFGSECLLVYTYPWLWALTPAQSSRQLGYNLWNSATGDIWHREHVPLSEKIKALSKSDPVLAEKLGCISRNRGHSALSQGRSWPFRMKYAIRNGRHLWQRLKHIRRLLLKNICDLFSDKSPLNNLPTWRSWAVWINLI